MRWKGPIQCFVAAVMALLLAEPGCRDRAVGVADDGGTPDAGGLDAGPNRDAGEPDAEVPSHCPLDLPGTADAEGMTPHGDFTGRHGWFGFFDGECSGMVIVIVENRQDFVEWLPYLYLPHEPENGLILEWGPEGTGTYGVSAFHRLAGQQMIGNGTITITSFPDFNPYDPSGDPRLVGTFTVDASGWGLEGQFRAPFCESLHIGCL